MDSFSYGECVPLDSLSLEGGFSFVSHKNMKCATTRPQPGQEKWGGGGGTWGESGREVRGRERESGWGGEK